MKRKLQVALTEESWVVLDALAKEANDGFKNGCITLSDVVNEIMLSAKLDVRTLQAKHTNIRKSLRFMASQKEMDVETAIRMLTEIKAKSARQRSAKSASAAEESET